MKPAEFPHKPLLKSLSFISLLAIALTCAAQQEQRFEQHYDGVLGISLDLTLYAPDATAMESAAQAAVAEISRLEMIFSTYREDSELTILNRQRSTSSASPELLEVLDACARWQRTTQNRFSCNLGRVSSAWDEAQTTQVPPDRAAMRALGAEITAAVVTIDRGKRSVVLPEPVDLEPSGLAKGYIIDRALAVLRAALPDATAIKVDIGGDAIYWGRPPLNEGWRVGVADLMNPNDSGETLTTLMLNGMAIAASGHVSRYRSIAGERFSHIFVPAEGWPVENGTGSVAIAPTAMAADAAATAMTLQSPADAAAWASALPELDGLAVDANGNQAFSDAWPAYVVEQVVSDADSVLQLDYVLPSFQGPYNRPYVAVWISDAQQNFVKNLLLLGQSERWARENSRWWRRVGRNSPGLVDGTARPTRSPGEYRVNWDGRDETGKVLTTGEYILHIEASRQNGGASYQRLPFTLGAAVKSLEMAADGELGNIRLSVGQPK